jgi:hypothetical protein
MSVRRVLATLAIVAAALWPTSVPAVADDPPPPGECPDTMPYADVEVGDTGIGWTVVRGTEPKHFAVEVIGTFDDGILPDHDVILIRVSDLPGHQFIENNRGIWAGMSGSPVYIEDKLVGAVAYGFSIGPTTLGGITPIDEMRAVGDAIEPTGGLSPRLRSAVKRHGPAAAAASDFGRLPLPMALPQGPTRGFRQAPAKRRTKLRARWDLGHRLEARGLTAIPMTGRSVTRTARVAATAPVPGGNFAASLSFGSLDAYGVGTTTFVCGDRVLAFGHPMLLTVQSNLGAHNAESFDIVDDLAFGTYKLAAAGELIGRVVQDRVAAIAARLDQSPDVIDLTSTATQGARTREGQSFISVRTPPFIAWLLGGDHAFYELLSLVDGFEDGSVGMALDVRGTRANGSPFRVTFGDRWIGADRRGEEFFTSVDAGAYGTGTMLSWIIENGFEKVTVETVDLDLDVGSPDRWIIEDMRVSRDGGPFDGGSPVCVRRGDELDILLSLRSQPGDETAEETLEVTVPRRFDRLIVRAGRGVPSFLDPGEFADFSSLLSYLRRSDRSDAVNAKVVFGGIRQASAKTLLNRVTVGSASVALQKEGTPGC